MNTSKQIYAVSTRMGKDIRTFMWNSKLGAYATLDEAILAKNIPGFRPSTNGPVRKPQYVFLIPSTSSTAVGSQTTCPTANARGTETDTRPICHLLPIGPEFWTCYP